MVKNSHTPHRQHVELISSTSNCLCRPSGRKLEISENLRPGRSFQVQRGNVLGLRPSSGSSRRSGHELRSLGQIKFSTHHRSFLTRLQASFKTLLRLKNFLIIKHFKVKFQAFNSSIHKPLITSFVRNQLLSMACGRLTSETRPAN